MRNLIWYTIIFGSVGLGGFSAGLDYKQSQWNKYKIKAELALNESRENMRILEQKHIEKEKELLANILDERNKYEETISNINSEYLDSLLKQQQRENYYRKRYEDKHCDNTELINKTIRLDTLLQEGTSLVRELEERIKHGDRVNDTLIKVIENDRKTINAR